MIEPLNKSTEGLLIPSTTTTSSPTAAGDDILLERKIALATEGFSRYKFCQQILKDRSRLSKVNALTVSNYIIAMKREINPRLSYKRYTIQFLSELSKAVGIEMK
jgi:hypothetical protein